MTVIHDTTIEEAIRQRLLRLHAEGCDLESADLPYRLCKSLGLDPGMKTAQFVSATYPKSKECKS